MPRGQYERRATGNQPSVQLDEEQGQAPETTQPAHSPRAAKERRERRRRDDGNLDRMNRMALAIPPEVQARLDAEGKTARWVRDDSKRQMHMHHMDWDVTPGVDPVPESRDSEGKLVLMEKYKDWYESDQRAKTNALAEQEKAIERGASAGSNDTRGVHNYVPEGNRISRQQGL